MRWPWIALPLVLLAASEAGAGPGDLRLSLSTDRTVYHPGEVLVLRADVRNGTGVPLNVAEPFPRGSPWPATLTLTAPDGTAYVLREDEQDHPSSRGCYRLAPGETRGYLGLLLRLGDGQPAFTPASPPLTAPGRWRVALRLAAAPVKRPGWWAGEIEANPVSFEMRPLKASERRTKVDPETWAAFERFRATHPSYDDHDRARVEAAMLRAENEGLARRLLDALEEKGHGGWRYEVRHMLVWRARGRTSARDSVLIAGIDGPWLERLALLTLEAWERDGDNAPPPAGGNLWSFRNPDGLDAVTAYLRLHPEAEAVRARLEALARHAARIRPNDAPPAPPPPQPGIGGGGTDPRLPWTSDGPFGPQFAWRVLLDLGVLHPGMTVEEAIGILGEPNTRGRGRIGWYLASPMHVNPNLGAEVDEGRIVRFVRTVA